MTIDAFLADDLRLSSFIECDCLMSAIIAGYAASSTSDAEFAVSYVSHIYFRVASRRDTSHQGHKIAALTIIATGFLQVSVFDNAPAMAFGGRRICY